MSVKYCVLTFYITVIIFVLFYITREEILINSHNFLVDLLIITGIPLSFRFTEPAKICVQYLQCKYLRRQRGGNLVAVLQFLRNIWRIILFNLKLILDCCENII